MEFTTKLVLPALSSAAGLCVGMFLSSAMKEKREFYSEYVAFLDAVCADLTFRQDGVRTVASSFLPTCKSKFAKLLSGYCENPSETVEAKFLTKSEQAAIEGLFRRIGRSDLITERAELESAKSDASANLERYRKKCEKQCPLAVKLGLLIGLAVGILML